MGAMDRLVKSLNSFTSKITTTNNNNANSKPHYLPMNSDRASSRGSINLGRQHDFAHFLMSEASLSQPAWGPDPRVFNYSREGYTSITFDQPSVKFSNQAEVLEVDEDAQLGINHLSSIITGGAHYWKAKTDEMADHMNEFSKQIDFDWLDTIIVKELLWYGNSVWKPRLGIANIRNKDDLMYIPISSFVRIWWDRQRIPYVYEFRGPEYQGYHRVEDIIHFVWNPVNASAFGTGFGTALSARRSFMRMKPDGQDELIEMPSLIDRKLETQRNMHFAQRRYLSRNVYQVVDGEDADVANLRADLADLDVMEDVVSGNKIEVQELGTVSRAFDPTAFADTVGGQIYKALNSFRGKQAGESQHTYANAKTSAILEEVGLASFPLAVSRQLQDKLFMPWYDTHPIYDPSYGGGILPLPWEETEYQLEFGRLEKKQVDTAEMLDALKAGVESGALRDPIEIRDILGKILPLTQEVTDQMDQAYNNPMVMPPYMQGQQNNPQLDVYGGADLAPRPQDYYGYTPDVTNPTNAFPQDNQYLNNYNIHSTQNYPGPNPDFWYAHPSAFINDKDPQPSDARLTFTKKEAKPVRKTRRKRLPKELKIDDINAFLATYD